MRKITTLTIFGILIFFFCMAQKPLSNSRRSSVYTYIYKCTNDELLTAFKLNKKPLNDNLFKNPIDSFKTDSKWNNNLPQGNYFLVSANVNTLKYQLIENHSAWLKLLRNNVDTRFVVTDAAGNLLNNNAHVTINRKNVYLDTKTATYRTTVKKEAIVKIAHNGVSNLFVLQPNTNKTALFTRQWFRDKWYRIKRPFRMLFNRSNNKRYFQRLQSINDYKSFLIFNKPKYKPRDTVKLKAFILDKHSNPINSQRLLVRIQEDAGDDGKVLGYVNSYRRGGFEYSFVLTDSLDLDEEYFISLEDPSSVKYNSEDYDGDLDDEEYLAKRKVFAAGKFELEDYELKSTTFNIRADKKTHEPGNPLSVYLKAVDENDLPVQDGRVELTAISINTQRFKAPKVFVPDTLWREKVNLETLGETKVTLPDSIFPKADLGYRIYADFRNSNNESQSKSEYIEFKYENYIIKHDFTVDTLKITGYLKGKPKPMSAKMYTIGNGLDTISKTVIQLPVAFSVNPNVAAYHVEADSVKQIIDLTTLDAGITLSGYRTADSLFARVTNPHKIPFWHWVTNGNKIFEGGSQDELFYKLKLNRSGVIKFSVSYIWGGKTDYRHIDVAYADKLLNIAVNQPLSVYPGQQVKTEITVSDANGKPVANADVTAWSLTRKFTDYRIPFIPYLGKIPAIDRLKSSAIVKALGDNQDSSPLNWEKWHRELGLDSIRYYQFTHPDSIYKVEETVPDSVTQVAPFVMRHGDIRPVNILYIDDEPVYFDQAQQLSRYSFKVTPGKHNFKFRLLDELILVDNVWIKKGIKLIFSVRDTVTNPRITVLKAPLQLDEYEAELIDKYLVRIVDNFKSKMSTVNQDEKLYLLNPIPGVNRYQSQLLVGPLKPHLAFLNVMGEDSRDFIVEPKYSYLFEPGFLKQKSIPTRYPFATFNIPGTKSTSFSDHALTNTEVNKLWQQYLDLRSHTTSLFSNPPVTDKLRGNLTITANNKNDPAFFIKNIIIYRKSDPNYLRVYPGNTTYFGALGAATDYRLFFLLANNAYYIADDVTVKANGTNYYEYQIIGHRADAVSMELDHVIANRTSQNDRSDYDLRNDALRLKEAFNEKYLDLSTFTESMAGRITDGTGEPLVGVSVIIKGTKTAAAVTDMSGQFVLRVPKSGILSIRYIGFEEREVDIQPGTVINIVMKEQSSNLEEVVVVGYGTQKRASLTGSVTTVGASSSISIRGNNISLTGKPLIIVDGVLVETMDGIAADSILETSILKAEAATAIYGARAANGVVIITTKKASNRAAANADPTQIANLGALRKNFSDYAYWQPKLTTDTEGKVSFVATFPDDITNWRTFVAGIGPQKQSGSAEAQIKSFKPLSANLVSPQFAVTGDEMSMLGKVLNYTTTPIKVNRVFKYNDQLFKQNNLEVTNSRIDTFNVVAAGKDSLTFEYTIKRESGYYDGERRKIPLMLQGITETKGVFEALNADTTVTMKFDTALGPVTFRAEASILPTLAEEARRLREYKYLCNEQLASKLKGLLSEKRISTYLGQPFKWERNITDVIKKLEDNRRGVGIWGWWKDSDEELWISLHAIEALTEAKKMGYTIKMDLNKLSDYLVYQMNSYKGIDKILCVQALRNLDAKVNYEQYINIIQKELTAKKQPSRYDTYRFMLLQQSVGTTIKTDSLLKAIKRTLFGNVYWGENSYNFFDNSIQLTVLAYKIFKAEGQHPELLTKIRSYFLEQRQQAEWRNTYESALILETILPDLLTADKQVTPPALTLSGAKTETVTTFPYSETFAPGAVTISKTGSLTIYITGYQQFWNSDPKKENREFTVDTWFEKNNEKQAALQGGKAVLLKAEITVKGDADYVMINIPIPAGCSYESKEQSWQNNEVHREYFKDRVSIFCRKLKQGKYTFSINLMPRYGGKYNLNPAKAEMMYFPVFYGREGMKKVNIED